MQLKILKAEAVMVKNEQVEYIQHTVISTCTCFVCVNAATV